jgi:hypothetical protein
VFTHRSGIKPAVEQKALLQAMSSTTRFIPRSVRLLCQYGDKALRPVLESGRYVAPLVPRRLAANIRRRAMVEGTFGSFSKETGVGWDPEWDVPRKMFMLRAPRGHLRDRKRPERAEKVTQAMKGMDDRIATLQREVRERAPKKSDIAYMFKRVAEISKGKSRK